MPSTEKINVDVITHYDLLISDGNDPVLDPPELQRYMDGWDGQLFIDLLGLDKKKSVLEIGCGTGRLARRIAPLVDFFCGIDISPRTVRIYPNTPENITEMLIKNGFSNIERYETEFANIITANV